MKKGFVIACIAAFFLLNEDLNHLIVMLVVGDFEFADAWFKTFKTFSIQSALIVGCFRLIPFILLLVWAVYTDMLENLKGKVALWASLVVSTAVIFDGYWAITEALYTDAHASSTSAIGYIWTPVIALFCSLIMFLIVQLVFWLKELVQKRAQ